jgi:hypothetical protein
MARMRAKSRKTKSSRAIKSEKHSILGIMKSPIRHLKEHSTKKGPNSNYKGRSIRLEDVGPWKNFITVKQVEALWEDSPVLKKTIGQTLKQKDTYSIIIGEPEDTGGMTNEARLQEAWNDIQGQINFGLRKCAEALGHTGYVMMGRGVSAKWISPDAEKNAKRKEPDLAGFFKVFSDDSQYRDDGPKTVFNRIPGDVKQFRKISRDMLPPDGRRYNADEPNREAQKVLNQVHGYMDQHEARYGYIVSNEELVCFRRTAAGWGQLEVSQAIRHDVEADSKTGVLNSKYVLFYLHWKLANDDGPKTGWRLCSFGKKPAPGDTTAISDDRDGHGRTRKRPKGIFNGFIKKFYDAGVVAFENKLRLLLGEGVVEYRQSLVQRGSQTSSRAS